MNDPSDYDPSLTGVLKEALTSIEVTPVHTIKNVKDGMLLIRPAWADVETTIGSRKVVDLWTITDKMITAAGHLLAVATKLRRMHYEEEQKLLAHRHK